MKNDRRQNEIVIPLIQVITDMVAIMGSFLFSYWLRFFSPLAQLIPVTKGFPGFRIYFWSSWVVILIWFFIFKKFDLYGSRRNRSKSNEFSTIVNSVSLGMLVIFTVLFFYRGFSYSRLVFVLIWISSIGFLTLTRFFIIHYENYLHRKGIGLLHVVIVGSNPWGEIIFEKINKLTGLGLTIFGYIGENNSLAKKTRYLGELNQVDDIIKTDPIDVFLIAFSEHENHQLAPLMRTCSGLNIEFYLLPDILEVVTSRLRVKEFEGIPVLKIKDSAITGWNNITKRWFDLSIALFFLLLLSPIAMIVALIIKLDSKGPIFFKQKRLGIDGREFDLIKFRTMIVDAEKTTGPVWTQKDDPRVTMVGRGLRRISFDEIPQLINVLKGDMSIVGPRPERPYFVEKFKSRIPKYLERHRVRSGMTGWAQVNGLRGNVPIEERTKYDVYYVENWSLLFDIKIIIKTIKAVLAGENT